VTGQNIVVSTTAALLVLLVIWVSLGLITGLIMGRRGNSWFGWAVIGCVLGPLVIPVALSTARRERDVQAITLVRGEEGAGQLRILVGIDGSVESQVAVRSVIVLLGDRIGSFTLAAVIDYDAVRPGWKGDDQQDAEAALADAERVADASLGGAAETVLLVGAPARALLEHAAATDADLLAIGSRGRGASTALLGSVATQLAAKAPVPVLIVGEHAAPATGP
jgi:nucleotide-binding universal stress UspA family protein